MLVMARFQHPYAVALYDASLNDPQGPCIVMEYIRGVTLDTLIKNNGGRISPGRAGRLLGQVCEVLQVAHSQGIIHRDMKPANLMVVDHDTPYEKVKVMDFGLVKLLDKSDGADPNVSGSDFAIGTPTYISPEQVRGEPLDHRSDLYSVGVILYEMLTGRVPYGVTSTMDLLLAHATEEPAPFSAHGSSVSIPSSIEEVVLSCLAKNPLQRPASAMELSERFAAALTAEAKAAQSVSFEDLEEATAPQANGTAPSLNDPTSVMYKVEAWLPESIAVHKLRGFIEDVGGEVLESVPGQIRVRLGGAGGPYQFREGRFAWLGLGRNSGQLQMELHMEQTDSTRQNQLAITVLMRSLDGHSAFDTQWRNYTAQIFCDLRAYLIGHTEKVEQQQSS
jgi:serine/threonine-protein kinase